MGPERPSVTARAVTAIALLVLFYALTAFIVFLLARTAFIGLTGEARVPRAVITVCVVAAGLLSYASLPRRTRFVPPGPELRPADQPALWAMIERVARESGQNVPTAAYWDPEANASVATVGGFLGIGGRRILTLGFPLVVSFDADALRAVVAHEFGHFHAGDVKLGPLVYVTQSAVLRATKALGSAASFLPLLRLVNLPFIAFSKLYLRVTRAVSRRQELSADALAARLVSRDAIARGLIERSRVERAWVEYIESAVEPVVAAKRRPPLASGWVSYLSSPEVRAEADRRAGRRSERAGRSADPTGAYDTHPSISDRLAALGFTGVPESAVTPPHASPIEVLGVEALDLELLAALAGNPIVREFPPIAWDRVVLELLEPRWREQLTRYATGIRGVVAEALPTRVEEATELGRRLNPKDAKDAAGANQRAMSVLTAALAVSLRRRGFTLDSKPGAPLRAQRGAETVDVEDVVRGVAAGRIPASQWAERCRALGIVGLDLGAEAAAYLA